MSGKPVVPRATAQRDLGEATDHYADEAGIDVALRFVAAAAAAFRLISERPGTGSALYAHDLGIPGVRTRRVKRFPYLIFYVEHEDHIDVWRVLHAQRDIPAWLSDDQL